MLGSHGKLLAVDLTAGRATTEPIPEDVLAAHLGGRGLGVHTLLDRQPAGVDPLGPENTLVFAAGPLSGHGISGGARVWVGSRSPLTGSLGESYSGGRFGRQLTLSGFDAIVVTGEADEPVVLEVVDGEATLRPADDHWGSTVGECNEALATGTRSVACIGPAGENEVLLAAIVADGNRAAAGRGLGAVMGAKGLKAVVVDGTDEPPVADPDRVAELRRTFASALRENDQLMAWGTFGTTQNVEILNERGILPTKNFEAASFEGADAISGAAINELTVEQRGCVNCPVECKNVVRAEFEDGTTLADGPEYETLAAFGSLVMNDDLQTIVRANQVANDLGIDTIGAGHAIAAVMEATDEYEWGDSAAILELLSAIAHREGIGDVLADGPAATAEALDMADEPAHVKGAPISMHDPRGKKGVGLSAAVSPRGGTHTEGFDDALLERAAEQTDLPVEAGIGMAETEGKPEAVVVFENAQSFVNSLVLCSHVVTTVGPDRNYELVTDVVSAVTGQNVSIADSLRIGERNFTLGKLFAAREGFTVEHDRLPKRLRQPVQGEPAGVDLPELSFSEDELAAMRERYYDLRGWTDEGIACGKLEAIGLSQFADCASADAEHPLCVSNA
ncbi:MAG: aldehyde ferredoxin oxidoreductase family protein [Halobacterium sp.]